MAVNRILFKWGSHGGIRISVLSVTSGDELERRSRKGVSETNTWAYIGKAQGKNRGMVIGGQAVIEKIRSRAIVLTAIRSEKVWGGRYGWELLLDPVSDTGHALRDGGDGTSYRKAGEFIPAGTSGDEKLRITSTSL